MEAGGGYPLRSGWRTRREKGGAVKASILDHVGVAVRDLEAALAFFSSLTGVCAGAVREVASEGVREAEFDLGGSRLQLISPVAEGAVQRFLERRGEGLHHLAFSVADLPSALERLRAAGVEVVQPAPRQAPDGRRIAFLHPSSCHGVLVELVEEGHYP